MQDADTQQSPAVPIRLPAAATRRQPRRQLIGAHGTWHDVYDAVRIQPHGEPGVIATPAATTTNGDALAKKGFNQWEQTAAFRSASKTGDSSDSWHSQSSQASSACA